MPLELVILLFVGCLALYLYLIQKGRITPTSAIDTAAPQTQDSTPETLSEQPISRPIDKAEETSLQGCFPWSVYYLQNIDYRPQAVICRGQLRTTPEVAYKTIQENVEGKFGDRFFVVFQEGRKRKAVLCAGAQPSSKYRGETSSDD